NARLRVTNSYTINTTASTVQAQTPLFTITPASNFTVRALLEGRHTGVGGTFAALPSTYSGGGARVKLYSNSGGVPGALVATAESEFGYDANAFAAGAVTNRGTNTGLGEYYATIPFVFTDLADGNYWVVLEQQNHLPVMSRTTAPFLYAGDDVTTTTIESGWDFALWNGTDNDATYAAFGSRFDTQTNAGYSTTGLNFNEGNEGYTGTTANYLAGVVAGDVVKDGQVNAADRVRVRGDAGTALVRSDITGDGSVNATDRDVVDRNFGKVSSIYNVTFPIINGGGNPSGLVAGNTPVNPFTFVATEDVALSQQMIAQASETSIVPPLALKTVNGLQGGYSYAVTAEPTRTGNFIDVPMYIQNNGAAFGMGNATFALDFNAKRLKFAGLTGTDKVTYTNKPVRGYNNMYSAPRSDADRAMEGVRTIEIDYDAFSRRGGEQVTNAKTYLGTLRFEIIGAPGSIGFKWHSSSAISGAQGEALMPYGDFKKIPGIMMYTASITAPTTGSRVGVGRTCNVQWTATGTSNVFVEISIDNGATWTRVNEKAVATSANALGFTAPSTLASDCFVRLVDEETGDEVSRSKKFALVNISAAVNRPAVSDPIYLGGTNDIIRWSSQGLTNVSFEFSSDNGTTWANATATQTATASSTGWKIPSVNSANCVVRMMDEETKSEVSRSGSFRVLAGTLSFLNPTNGERFKPGVTTRLRWRTASNVNLVDLQISLDGGNTWALMQSNVDGKKQFIDWVIPTVNSSNVVIRAIYPGMEELEYSRTPAFRIDGPVSVEVTDESGYFFGNIAPNPATSFASVDFTIPTNGAVNITMFNELGEKVATIANGVEYASGTHSVVLSTDALPQGAYLVQFTVGTRSETRKVVVVK
ncbi:MAG: T9SS type A sorting domain-containing protein, partial [Candidatus Kapabacteria bacterium]|nr:T9SS type A sorting domain-containing protein [Candidatus Kapabacteria bacterium]